MVGLLVGGRFFGGQFFGGQFFGGQSFGGQGDATGLPNEHERPAPMIGISCDFAKNPPQTSCFRPMLPTHG
jgi:hypothetical protein